MSALDSIDEVFLDVKMFMVVHSMIKIDTYTTQINPSIQMVSCGDIFIYTC